MKIQNETMTEHNMNQCMRFPTMWYVRPAKPQISQSAHMRSLIRAFASRLDILSVKLQTEHHLEFLILKGGCRGSSESIHVKMPHCWKSHAGAHMLLIHTVKHLEFSTS